MDNTLTFTFVGTDRPGLVDTLSATVAAHGGNWLESRMSELAGQFAGIVRVAVEPARAADLRAALQALSQQQLWVHLADADSAPAGGPWRALQLSILGNDRPGIVHEVAHALAQRNINVREMNTSISSAPMSGEPLFGAQAQIQVPATLDLAELRQQLNHIADTLTLSIELEDAPN